jgi:hypothetical protein
MSVLTNPYVIVGSIALTVIPMAITARIKPQPHPAYAASNGGD